MELLSQLVCSFDTTIASTIWLSEKAEPIHLYSHQVSMSACYPNMKHWPAHHPDCLLNSALMDRLPDVCLSHEVSWAASQHGYIAQEGHCHHMWSMHPFLQWFFEVYTTGQSQLPSEVGRSEAAIAVLRTKTLRLREVKASLLWTLFIRNSDQSLYLIEPEMYLMIFPSLCPKTH